MHTNQTLVRTGHALMPKGACVRTWCSSSQERLPVRECHKASLNALALSREPRSIAHAIACAWRTRSALRNLKSERLS